MPTYDYECHSCGYKMLDVYQPITSEALTYCTNCENHSLYRVIHAPYVAIKGSPATVGQLAELNSKKMGKSKVEELSLRDKDNKKEALKEAKAEIRSKINSMNDNQKRKYIEDGTL
jgi:putative FmdB family regulatory protein